VIIIERNSRGTPFFEKVKKIKDVTRTELTEYQFSEMNKKTPPPLQKLLTYAARFPDTTKEKKNPRDWTAEKWSRFLNNTLTTDQEGYGCLEHDIVETCIKLARTRPVLLPGFKHEAAPCTAPRDLIASPHFACSRQHTPASKRRPA
jgi:hypothetical protein